MLPRMPASRHDTDTARLIRVGPMQKSILRPARLKSLTLQKAPQVAVDGGGAFAVDPVLWVGDGDSGIVPKSVPVCFKSDQGMTDFRFCLETVRIWNWRELHIFGFLDGRKDHELANLGELHAALKKRRVPSSAVFYDAKNRPVIRFFQARQHKINLHGTFSVLVIEAAKISLAGKCKYPARNVALAPLSGRGVSNVASGDVRISATKPFFIIG